MDPAMLGMGVGIVVYIVGIVVAIVWIILPFAIFGTKPLLRELIAEVRQMRMLLAQRSMDSQNLVPRIRADRDS